MTKSFLAALACLLACAAAITAQPPGVPGGGPGTAPRASDPDAPREPPKPMPVPRSLVKRRGEQPIVIDGALEDWPSAPPMQLDDARQLSGTALGAWRGPRDLAARAFLVWDPDYLYFAAVVRDDWHKGLSKGSPRLYETPPADSIVLSFDPKRDTRSLGRDPGREEDREFWLAEVGGQGRQVVQWDRLRGTARYAEQCLQEVIRDDERGLTYYEARIAWSQVLPPGTTPEEGLVCDLQVVVNDFDEATDPIAQTRIGWTFGTGPRIDPGLFGSVMLVGALEKQVEELPEFPSPPRQTGDPVPGQAYWVRFYERLRQHPPVAVTADGAAAPVAGGAPRLARLEELEQHVRGFPRVDYLEYHNRVHRRMRRELAGQAMTGLPFFWDLCLRDVAKRAAAAKQRKETRVFKLPVSGWLVVSPEATFAIDPAGEGLGATILPMLDFAVLTSPRDPTKRNDQLLLRMAASKRQVVMHQSIHVPGVQATAEMLATIGRKYEVKGLALHIFGVTQEDLVSMTIGFAIEWPDGRVLVHSGASVDSSMVKGALGRDTEIDLLLLSPLHQGAVPLAQRLAARVTAVDDAFMCERFQGSGGRVPLEQVFELQMKLRPHRSMLLAPGESIEIER